MSKSLWLTPEEVVRRKKRNKTLLYISIIIGTVVLSAIVTVLANQL